jgi:hypothetical protein
MILGDMLLTGANATSPWFARFGNAATFFCEVLAQTSAPGGGGFTATAQVTVDIETKKADEADSAAVVLASLTSDGLGVFPVRASALKELVRFAYTVAYAPELDPPPADPGYMQFRMLPPAWEDDCVEAIPG